MKIGVPKEIKNNENRVGLTPEAAASLVEHGHSVFIESSSGSGIGFFDQDYMNVGCQNLAGAREIYDSSELIIKVKEPMESEIEYLDASKTLFTYLHLAGNPILADKLINSGVKGIAYETVTSSDGSFPLLAPMSAIAGQIGFNVGNYFLLKQNQGRGVLLGSLDGMNLGLVTIIGCGVAGEEALKKAVQNNVEVNLIDLSEERLDQLKEKYQNHKINFIHSTPESIHSSIKESDLVLGCVYSLGKNAPKVVSDAMLDSMKPGSVMVDISIDQGGCFETSSPTTHDAPTFIHKDIVHYCVTNMPGAVPLTATNALNRATLKYIHDLANKGIDAALSDDEHLMNGLNIQDGVVVNTLVKEALDELKHQ